ncbi:hypothetical protein ACOGYG_002570 [Edwardsiella piscicida]|uniref:hypothetical protein n=1 Tax=Edwardsiella piscicida TaxID=1263550 RepID=UPI0002C15D9A|nr:hypothetical protein [Edwardsiella piscicida]AGH72573.1 hypothetical protein ETAC_02200 [Edwardsiella piscicida C07-087]EKS7779962.1 hypothetical protein [Edwardsiella piscicida]
MKDKIDDSVEVIRLEEDFRNVFFMSRPQTEADALEMQMKLKQLVDQLEQHGCTLPDFNQDPDLQIIVDDPFPVHTMEKAIKQAYQPVYAALSAKMIAQGQKDWCDAIELARRYDHEQLAKQKS